MDYDESDTCWHLLCTTYGGNVSILKNLDAPTARQAYRQMKPDAHPVKYINRPEKSDSFAGGWRTLSDRDVAKVDILGPEGAELCPWRGVEPRVVDLSDPSRAYA